MKHNLKGIEADACCIILTSIIFVKLEENDKNCHVSDICLSFYTFRINEEEESSGGEKERRKKRETEIRILYRKNIRDQPKIVKNYTISIVTVNFYYLYSFFQSDIERRVEYGSA